jgi:hypothetical protein
MQTDWNTVKVRLSQKETPEGSHAGIPSVDQIPLG